MPEPISFELFVGTLQATTYPVILSRSVTPVTVAGWLEKLKVQSGKKKLECFITTRSVQA